MDPSPQATLPRRAIPGADLSLSLLGFTVEGGAAGVSNPGIVQRLRQARRAGVTTFDLAGSAHPAHARWLLAEAFPTPDPELVVIATPDVETEETLVPSTSGVPTTFTRVAPPSPALGPAPPFATILEVSPGRPLSTDGRIAQASRAVRLAPDSERLPDDPDTALYSGPFSLLDNRLGRLFESPRNRPPASLLARDPFAEGRLDGSRFSGNWLERGPSATPASLRTLSVEFEPVLRLGFLTADHRRTMAQAALQYAGSRPWVACVLAPLPPADRVEELLSAFSRPGLTAQEIHRIERPGSPEPGPVDLRRSNSSPG